MMLLMSSCCWCRALLGECGAVSPFDQTRIDAPGPCVLFATPGMLSGGLSLEVFRHWAPLELNMVVVPG